MSSEMRVNMWLVQVLVVSCAFGLSSAQNYCYTPENTPGLCRSLYDCPNLLVYFRGTITPEITTYLRALQCRNGNGRFPYVCCALNTGYFGQQQSYYPNWLPQGPPPSALPPTQQISPTRQQNVDNQPNGNFHAGYSQCGLPSLATRIFGGNDAQLDDYPWIVLLEYRNRSLINARYVLTAAHCLVGAIETKVGELVGVRLGEYDITKEIDCLGNTCADPVLHMGVEEKIAHEGYDEKSKNRAHDIGLIRLSGEVTYTDYIRPICLPTLANSPRAFPNERLVSAGWGRTLTRHQSTTKQHVELPLADQDQCIRKYLTLGIPISDTQLCAGGVYAQDTCEGDSGNALMRFVSNAWVIEGVVSFGRGCGLEDWPAVYTRVSNYVDWIQRRMRP